MRACVRETDLVEQHVQGPDLEDAFHRQHLRQVQTAYGKDRDGLIVSPGEAFDRRTNNLYVDLTQEPHIRFVPYFVPKIP